MYPVPSDNEIKKLEEEMKQLIIFHYSTPPSKEDTQKLIEFLKNSFNIESISSPSKK